jgi:GTP-binding protein
LERADVAVLVLDATRSVAKQDAVIAGEADRCGCGIVIAANKWDLVKARDEGFAKRFDEEIRDGIKFAEYAPIVHLSALTGARAPKGVEAVARVARTRNGHIATAELNRFLARVAKRQPPSSPGRGEVKILYGTQVASRPPTFLLFTNVNTRLHFSYERFLKNRLRETFGFEGTPIRLKFRPNRKRG